MQVSDALRLALTEYLDPIFTEGCGNAQHVAVAVSGGPDSMALTLLAQDWCQRHGRHLHSFTVDHGLRAESAQEAKQVAQWMQMRGIAHAVLTPAPSAIHNIQNRARTMRYEALTQACKVQNIPHLLVAHHADDQAETVALQQHRGDSPSSRSGMAFTRSQGGVTLVRPLLGIRKQTLMDYLQAQQQTWIDDPSNASDAYARNRLRRTLDDATYFHLWQETQTQGAMRAQEDKARLHWMQQHATSNAQHVQFAIGAWRSLNESMRMDILSRAIQQIGGTRFRVRYQETKRLTAQLDTLPNGKATLGHCFINWDSTTLSIAPEHADQPSPPPTSSTPFHWFAYPLFSVETPHADQQLARGA